jgi:hypothetical protein
MFNTLCMATEVEEANKRRNTVELYHIEIKYANQS